jgi:hypothetical protein
MERTPDIYRPTKETSSRTGSAAPKISLSRAERQDSKGKKGDRKKGYRPKFY